MSNIGKTKRKLYSDKYHIHNPFKPILVDFNKPRITIYGPEEQGKRKRLTKIPITKAPHGEITDWISFIIFGLQDRGTSIKNPHSPYQK